ncbi:hypothetical protein DLJ54_04930 [Corynebacterium heidelbergense]|uniref:NlpC/P60 domain-containing protein n=1 Tax=Corynebacterium heidelbergense TaxID=2055947 RepID=A0A364V637_9CORY|nr:NlpC/P60 family protein [Corynebacterium heidelbergense]RAV32078.1 hypothetical protein DLJ54_04930 [Corynebacterium heidelbergense]
MPSLLQENTIVLNRPKRRGRAAAHVARSSRALLVVSLTAGTAFAAGPAASAQESPQTAEGYLAGLVSDASSSQRKLADVENSVGGLRERANKARVDLSRAQAQAQKAQSGVTDAKSRLGKADQQVVQAQQKLDELARSAYATGGDAAPVSLAAGSDAVGDTLDRNSYLQAASQRQRGVVDRLDLARTQTANEESGLRASRDAANNAVQAAVDAHESANDALSQAQRELAAQRDQIASAQRQMREAQAKVRAARAAVDKQSANASSFDKRRAAEAAVARVEANPPAAPAPAPQKTQAQAQAPQAQAQAQAPQSQAQEPDKKAAESEAPATSTDSSAPLGSVENIPTEFEASSSGDDQRQRAINGLLAAGQSAAMAGFAAAANGGSPQDALNAAAQAGRDTAGREYDAAMGVSQNTPGAPDGVDPNAGEGTVAPTLPGVTNPGTQTPSGDTSGTAAEKIERVINRGSSQLGMPYAWGGGNAVGPTLGIRDGGVADSFGDYEKVGFDCSGLMVYAFAAAGIYLDHYSGYQYTAGRQVPASEAKRGDMLFWGASGEEHVALYLGDGQMLEAPQSGSVVSISPVRYGGMAPYAVRMIE